MACGSCKKSSTKKVGTEGESSEKSSILRKIGTFILALVVSIVALPFLFIVLVSGLYQGWSGEGFDIGKMISVFKKKEPEVVEEEEINSEDYELVGVDKIG